VPNLPGLPTDGLLYEVTQRLSLFVSLPVCRCRYRTNYPSPSPNPSSGQTPQADQTMIDSSTANSNPSSTELSPVVVIGKLNEARDQIVPYLGATRYSIGQEQIQTQSQGSNAPFNQVILRMPGVAQDSYGQLHVRGEHANLQFRIGLKMPNAPKR